MIKVWLEWDYGQDQFIFNNEDDAKQWLEQTIDFVDFSHDYVNIEDILEDGLAGFEEVTIWHP